MLCANSIRNLFEHSRNVEINTEPMEDTTCQYKTVPN